MTPPEPPHGSLDDTPINPPLHPLNAANAANAANTMMYSVTRPLLLVEDNPMDVDLTIRALKRRRISNEVIVARDGEEAAAMIGRWEAGEPVPVVILLDLKLPRLSGLEVLSRIKRHPTLRTIPIVVLTTSRDDTDIQQAYQLGANSYIVKPVDFDKFLEVAAQIELYWVVHNTSPT
jgi:CheY-like chemotaxis protein